MVQASTNWPHTPARTPINSCGPAAAERGRHLIICNFPAGALLDWSLVRFIVSVDMRSALRVLKEFLEFRAVTASAG